MPSVPGLQFNADGVKGGPRGVCSATEQSASTGAGAKDAGLSHSPEPSCIPALLSHPDRQAPEGRKRLMKLCTVNEERRARLSPLYKARKSPPNQEDLDQFHGASIHGSFLPREDYEPRLSWQVLTYVSDL